MPQPLPAGVCPCCGHDFDCTASLETDTPTLGPGDVAVCIRCGVALRFNEDMTVRRLSAAEWLRLSRLEQRALSDATAMVMAYQVARGGLQ
jgi:hypothetical protein